MMIDIMLVIICENLFSCLSLGGVVGLAADQLDGKCDGIIN